MDATEVVANMALHGSVPKASAAMGCSTGALYTAIRQDPALAAHVAEVRAWGRYRGKTCGVSGCSEPAKVRSLCRTHNRRVTHGVKGLNPDEPIQQKRLICSVDGCGGKHQSRGFCRDHYGQWLLENAAECAVASCSRPSRSKGFCLVHYQRFSRYGDPLGGPAFRPPRGTAPPRWLQCRRRDEDRAGLMPETIEYVAVLRQDPCAYCGAPFEHLDHITPFASGGRLTVDNITAACAFCNLSKSAASLLFFLRGRCA